MFKILHFEKLEIPRISNLENSKKFVIWIIPKISNLENYNNFQFRKLQKFPFWKNLTIFNSENSKNFEFGKFQKFLIWKIPKIFKILPKIIIFLKLFYLKKLPILKIVQFGKLEIKKISNLENSKKL